MDAGDIIAEASLELSSRETTQSLSEVSAITAAHLLRELLGNFNARAASARPQKGEAVYCHEIKKEDGLIDWDKSAAQIDAQIRAYTPWPLSFTCRGKDTLIILEGEALEPPQSNTAAPGTVLGVDKSRGILIQTGGGILAVSRLQWRTKKALDWKAFCNGERDFIGVRLG
jgi:methionyl-tRNA formyltransferase